LWHSVTQLPLKMEPITLSILALVVVLFVIFIAGLAAGYFIMNSTAKELNSQLETAAAQFETAQTIIATSEAQLVETQNTVGVLEENLTSANQFTNELEVHIDRMEVREATLKDEFSTLEETCNEKDKALAQVRTELANLKSRGSGSKTDKQTSQKSTNSQKLADKKTEEKSKPASKQAPSQLTQRVSLKAPAKKGGPSHLTQRVSLKAPARSTGEKISKKTTPVRPPKPR